MVALVVAGAQRSAAQTRQLILSAPHPGVSDTQTDSSDPFRSELFRVRGVPSVTVQTLTGTIEVIRNPALDGVQIDLYVEQAFSFWSRSRSLDDYRILFQQRGDQIIASVEDRRTGSRVYNPGNTRFTFIVQVPGEKASLNLRSLSGDISVDGISGTHFMQNHAGNLDLKNLTGEVKAASTAGDIRILNSTGVIYANTISGSIFVNRSDGEVRLRSVSGDVYARNHSGVLVAASTSGHIQSDFIDVSKGIHMETISGNVELVIPHGPGYTITAKGMAFDFQQLNLEQATQNIRSGNASVILRNGSIPVNLTSVSGKIKVRDRP